MTRRLLSLCLCAGLLFIIGGCSSDANTPVGSEFIDDLLGSKPGVVFQDTVAVVSDTVLAYNSLITQNTKIEVGRLDGYDRSIVMRAPIASPPPLPIDRATLQLVRTSGAEGTRVLVFELAEEYTEGDSLSSLVLGAAVFGTDTLSLDDPLGKYDLPLSLVQKWVHPDSTNNGIAIVYAGNADALSEFWSSEAADARPTLEIVFKDGNVDQIENYVFSNDATFVRPAPGNTTTNLIVSDAFIRRIWFQVDLGEISDSSAVHGARMEFDIVPGSISASDIVELYIPDSDDPTSVAFLDGVLVNSASYTDTTTTLSFAVTRSLLGILDESLDDNGFVMRYATEKLDLRFVEFYPSSHATQGPRLILTSSSPAEFR